MRRRQILKGILGLPLPASLLAGRAHGQASQRARQIRDRRACEEDLPGCKPEIRSQLEAEKRRIWTGLAGLTVLVTAAGAYVFHRHRLQTKRNARLARPTED